MNFKAQPLDDEILDFVTTEAAYLICTHSGLTLHVRKCRTRQPAIEDEDNYTSFMWADTLQGYFLLRQQFWHGKAQPWRLIREITPQEASVFFFDQFDDQVLDYVLSEELHRCPEPPAL